jgi:hypothetical protein
MTQHDPENEHRADAQPQAGTASNRKPHTLRVRVVHGDFRKSAGFPLVFGHYEDDTIVDVEAQVDEHVGGRLSQRYRLGVYPGALGSADVVRLPGRHEQVVLVVGLGLVGALTVDGLADGVTRAVLRYVAEAEDRGSPIPAQRDKGLSFLLIGSNSPGLSIDDSVLGIVRGVLAANRTLRPLGVGSSRSRRATRRLEIDAVEFVELYENRAESAARAASDLLARLGLQVEPDEQLDVAAHVVTGQGGQTTTPTVSGHLTWWRRILVRDKGHDGLHYLTLSDSARAEGAIIAPHRANVEHYVAALSGTMAHDDDAAATLFHLVLPNALKPRLSAERDVLLVFERAEGVVWGGPEAAGGPLPPTHYPWELIGERRGGDVLPLALRVGLVRQLRVDDVRPAGPPRGHHVLVIGAPKTDGLPDLPGASAEAQVVAASLERSGFTVKPLIEAEGRDVLEALFRREWLALHVAGHGGYLPEDRARSGVYLNDGMRLTAGEIEQLPVVPSLVFLNCCHVGTLDAGVYPGLAASIAEQLIRRGVRAVVAAGWSVNDDAARTFAETFYDEMGRGAPFGAALKRARCATHRRHPEFNTWGAYQAYGDPGFVLRLRHENGHGASESVPLSRREFRLRLAAFRRSPPADPRQARERLEGLLSHAAADWREDPVVRELEGDAWRQVGDFDRAVAAYRTAVGARSGDVSLRALLHLSNIEIRRAAAGRGAGVAHEFREALARIERVLALQASGEAWTMKGSALKRLATSAVRRTLRPGATVRAVLGEASRAYAEALRADASCPPTGRIPGGSSYPLLNQLVLELLLGQARDLERRLQQVERTAKAPEDAETLFERAVPANVGLLRWLAKGAPANEVGDVAQRFTDARQDASEGEFLSSVEQAEWLAQARRALLGLPPAEGEREQARTGRDAEERLRAALRALSELAQAPLPADAESQPKRKRPARAKRRSRLAR